MQIESYGWFDTPEEIRNFSVVVSFATLLLTTIVFVSFRVWHWVQRKPATSQSNIRKFVGRCLEALCCSMLGFLIGFADYIYRSVRFTIGAHPHRIYTAIDYITYLYFYIYVSFLFSFPIIVVFSVLYLAFRESFFHHWILCIVLGAAVGGSTAYFLVHAFVHYPGFVPRYMKSLMPRCTVFGVSAFLFGAFFAWQARHLTMRCSQPLDGVRLTPRPHDY